MPKMMKVLPEPDGKYKVGVKHLSFVDENRIDPFMKEEGKNRDIPCLVWYPIDSTENYQTRPLITRDLMASLKEYITYKAFSNKLCEIKTNSFEDAPVSNQESKFPVLLFNFGFSSFMEQSAIQMEHLASHGYIVISIGHPFDGTVSYPDGRSIGMDQQAVKDVQKSQNRKQVNEIRKKIKLLQEPLPSEKIEKISRDLFGSGGLMEKKIDLWVEDICFIAGVVQKLETGEIISIFENRLLLEKGIGSFGHSYGGASSILASALQENISCAINQDGGMYGGFNKDYQFDKPLMFMESEETQGMSKYFYNINQSDSIRLYIRGSKHLDYSDITAIHRPFLFRLMGTFGKINGEHMVKINCDYVLAFFDKYLKGIETPILEKSAYQEVILESKNN